MKLSTIITAASTLIVGITGCISNVDNMTQDNQTDGFAVYTPHRDSGQDMGLVLLENNDPAPKTIAGCTWTSDSVIPQDHSSYVDIQLVDITTTTVPDVSGYVLVSQVNTNVVSLQAGERVVFQGFPYDVPSNHRLVMNVNQHGNGQEIGYGSVWLWW